MADRLVTAAPSPPRGGVVLSAVDGSVHVPLAQRRHPLLLPPRPRYETIDRPGRIGIPEFLGQDPYRMLLYVRIDSGQWRESVEDTIIDLYSLAEVPAGASRPREVKAAGAIPAERPNLTWLVTDIADPEEIQSVDDDPTRRRSLATTVTLTQAVGVDRLTRSLKPTKASKGTRVRTTEVKAGERDLYAVCRRYYGDASRASDVAVANRIALGTRLTTGRKLRMPA